MTICTCVKCGVVFKHIEDYRGHDCKGTVKEKEKRKRGRPRKTPLPTSQPADEMIRKELEDFVKYGPSKHQVYETAKIIVKNGLTLHPKVIIGDYAFIALDEFRMHSGAQIAPHACLSGGGKVLMYSNSVVGFGAQLITGTDTPKGKFMCEAASPEERSIVRGSITLKPGAYIGSHAIICVSRDCPDIVIGKNSVVGANSYIDSWVPDNTVVHPVQNLLWSARVQMETTCPFCRQTLYIYGPVSKCTYCNTMVKYSQIIGKEMP